MPVIDQTALADLVSAYETETGYTPTDNYGGLLANGFNYGPLEPYFLGQSADAYWAELGGIYLLGCRDCGDVGCWPLIAEVKSTADRVMWMNFQQPHRPERDYSGFGPFVFDKQSYVSEIREATARLDRTA
ncbi:MAG: hypothetical protein P4L57_15505 [Rhizomicrobium sp.]|nr:hypothetical protein [Rhizomicrobium sp.]